MKLNDVLLVIGAGAHVPYGFPTGAQLREDILELEEAGFNYHTRTISHYADDIRKGYELFNSVGMIVYKDDEFFKDAEQNSSNWKEIYITKQVREFVKVFRESQNPSIDSYLATFTEGTEVLPEYRLHIKIGKIIIEGIIKHYLGKISVGRKYEWIQHLFNTHYPEWTNVEYHSSAPLNIITFNYDTFFESCLEQYLKHNFLKNYRNLKTELVNIEHVYGSVKQIDTLKVIGEDRYAESLEVSNKLANIINRVKKIYFLGFGFDKSNLELLFSKANQRHLQNISMFSTNIGLNEFDTVDIEKICDGKFSIDFYENELDKVCSFSLIKDREPLLNE
ncbi:hypothetical protein BMS_1052 [Halobacteriovorax marinus SJ]|uniref:Uncharacterized protein n=1 Tax=Halobacteriovorax marinus (strain ATCC BAA-682 / DSM 15412 / SJ) TaxID=862908 RepID=E1WXX9_HALMS|nr:SIR2 family protein [Halobacteriovorax marinus]CBW25936.1 hypothetical protein BMS_1052 [Halobacteriovorax marinus SJ]